MKIYFKKYYFKLYIERKKRKSLKNSRRFATYIKKRNLKKYLSALKKHSEWIADKYSDFKKVKAPLIFSMIYNTEGVVKFIRALKENFDKKNKVFVLLNHVKKIDYSAIVVLLSIMIRFKSQKIEFNGDVPLEKEPRKILEQSKFFPNLYKFYVDSDRYKIGDLNTIHTHAWKNVDSKLGEKIIEKASEAIWKDKRRCQGVQRALVELMQNTNNHATIGKTADKHWWLSVNHMPDERKVCFSFVDFGVGIFESLENKTTNSKFFGWATKMIQSFKYGNNAELFKLILNGDLHKTVTGEYYRGKGLPGIKEALKRNQLSNLFIITNNVHADVSNDNYKILEQNFSGTFLYWELIESNQNCYGTN